MRVDLGDESAMARFSLSWDISLLDLVIRHELIQAWLNGTEIDKRYGANVDAYDTCGAPQESWIYTKSS